ncbi:MAG TPA: sigma-70 family RNA polymerase sigma factor [Candidatus Mediterraneibacter cottocaccae]|nr:sigma-70 family RNA polymerase sigma factor [Candidatus Mediterraneibacter cottocaccae]
MEQPQRTTGKPGRDLPSPEELIRQYAALIWKTTAAYLDNPEDIRECVNDTFLAFYMQRDAYDPDKGSPAALLVSIARNKAVDRFRKIRADQAWNGQIQIDRMQADRPKKIQMKSAEELTDPHSLEEQVITEIDLQAALNTLSPEELDLIRMKYYGGMSIQEIAKSMNLPYETVKKRHQRSLVKLRRFLTMALILMLIAAVLTACAYIILRYFGIVPGYGVNTDPSTPFYIVDVSVPEEQRSAVTGDGLYTITVQKGILNEGTLCIQLKLVNNSFAADLGMDATMEQVPDGLPPEELFWYNRIVPYIEITCLGVPLTPGASLNMDASAVSYQTIQLSAGAIERQAAESGINTEGFCVEYKDGNVEIPFSLIPVTDVPPDSYCYEMTEFGGFLVDTFIQDGRLTADIYTLKEADWTLGIPSDIYAVSEDGTVLPKMQETSGLFSQTLKGAGMTTIDFGPAEPGSYKICMDTLSLSASLDPELRVNLSELLSPGNETVIRNVPLGTARLGGPTDKNPNKILIPEEIEELLFDVEKGQELYIPIEVTPSRDDMTCETLGFSVRYAQQPSESPVPCSFSSIRISDPVSGAEDEYVYWGIGIEIAEEENFRDLLLTGDTGGITYCWKHPLIFHTEAQER